jgi:hypothetical protein
VAWTSLNNNYGVTQFYHGTPYPDGATYFGGTQDNGTLKSDDVAGEQAWEEVFGGDGGYTAVDSGNTNILFVETTRLSLRKSTNGGSSFSPATSGISEASGNFLFIAPFAMDPANSQRLWIGGFFLWRTTNSAGVWSQASAITSGTGSVSAIAVAPTDGNKVLAGMSDGIIHRTDQGLTSNAGTSWPFTQPVAGAFVSSVTFDPTDDNIAYATYSTFGVAHVWKSTNSGATWTSIDGAGPTALPDIPAHSIVVDPANTNKLVVGTDLGVFVSTDGGANWAAENTGFANVVTESLSVQSNGSTRLFAFTHGRGAWRVPLPANTAPNVSITMPNDGDSFNIDVDPTIDFAATAADVEEGDLSSGLGWTSNQDGSIGSGASFSTTLSVAVHQITAEVTDGGGLDGSDQIEIAVGTTSCPADLTISGTISSNQDRQTVRTATLQSLTVTASGNLNVRAGQSAVFVPPVTIAGDLEVEISGNPCP